ncbi:MAG: M24 family metallopeptidase [Chitinophagaceae bacterium]|nr:M24 family metallopeptidase [Chitinophagaceae bacterium]
MKSFLLLFFFVLFLSARAQVLSPREQARVIDEILADRFDNLLPRLMEQTGIDMWVLVSREYNEDPVLRTMLPATWLSARRRTILVFYNNTQKKQYEKLAIARYNVGENIKASWDMQKFPNQWDALMDIINTRQPAKIGINLSAHFGHADGMDHTDYTEFINKLPLAYKNKVVSAEDLAVRWLETRTEREMQVYPQLISITHRIIEEGFSEKVITPGITTTDDVVWWFRKKISDIGLGTWFHPSVAVQRSDSASFEHLRSFSNRPKEDLIQPGDLLHVDIGITYLRLNTDIQQHAYVLKPGEKEAPKSIRDAFVKANRLQDILTSQFAVNKTGNQILAAALAQAKKEGIAAVVYTHPLGFHGHAAGPTIGLWDQQGGVPGTGDYPLHYKTAYSIELNAASDIPEWKKSIRIMLEEDGYFDESGFRYINGRQKEIYLIPRIKANLSD